MSFLNTIAAAQGYVLGRRPPTFLCLGPAKTGTTNLHHYLRGHPEVSMPETKERDYFRRSDIPRARWEGGWDDRAIRGECDPRYFLYPERITAEYPDVKIIFIVREPIERMISHVQHHMQVGHIPRAAAYDWERVLESVNHPEPLWCYRHSEYQRNIEPFMGMDLCVLPFRLLRSDPQSFYDRVCDFIGASPYEAPEGLERLPSTHTIEPMSPDVRARFEELFAPSNQWVFDRFGIDVRSGSI